MLADAATEKPASERMRGSAIPTELGPCRSLEALTVGVKSHVTFFRRKERRSATSIELLAIDGAVNRNTNHNHTLPD